MNFSTHGIDHDPVIICPYDSNHKIAKSRIQRHLVKCEKNFPPNFKRQCPYDATHRVFEHELIDHVKDCPMKHTCPIEIGHSKPVTPDITMQKEYDLRDDSEIWDEDLPDNASTLDEESITFEYPCNQKSNMLVVKRYGHKLRRPFGLSESQMLETTYATTDDDTMSVTSDMGIGRGRIIQASCNGLRGAYSGARGAFNGLRGISHRGGFGIRGRSLH